MNSEEHVSIQVAQQVAKKIKRRLEQELEICHGTYKTTSSWSNLRYVCLRYPVAMSRTLSEQMMYEIDRIVGEECEAAGIDHNHRGVTNFFGEGLVIDIFSHDPRKSGGR